MLQKGYDVRDDHGPERLADLDTADRFLPHFSNFSVHNLRPLYAREFRPQNIYLLVTLDGCMYDIS